MKNIVIQKITQDTKDREQKQRKNVQVGEITKIAQDCI